MWHKENGVSAMIDRIFADEAGDILKLPDSRRMFMKTLLAGGAGAAFTSLTSSAPAATIKAPGATVSFTTGTDRREMIRQVLEPLRDDVASAIGDKQILIKPNLVGDNGMHTVTHPDAIRGILDFLGPIHNRQVIIGESTGRRYDDESGTFSHYRQYGYPELEREYNVKLVDLNHTPASTFWIMDKNGMPLDVRLIDAFSDPSYYVISAPRMKNHNCVMVTLSAKNILMAAPLVDGDRHDKQRIHNPGSARMNFNLFLMAQNIQPELAVIDGLAGIHGNGPQRGDIIEHGIAAASTDWIAADRVGCLLMDYAFDEVGYLTYCHNAGIGQGDLQKITIIGPDPHDSIKHYEKPESYEAMLKWRT
jgi:uncharacterized protein (DUF362 family)